MPSGVVTNPLFRGWRFRRLRNGQWHQRQTGSHEKNLP